MIDERAVPIKIGGQEFELLLSTGATEEIEKHYGDIGKFGEKLKSAKNFSEAADEITWTLTILANQPILIHNFRHPEEQKALLTEREIELFTVPYELYEYVNAIITAFKKGMKRNIQSEADPSKNTAVG